MHTALYLMITSTLFILPIIARFRHNNNKIYKTFIIVYFQLYHPQDGL